MRDLKFRACNIIVQRFHFFELPDIEKQKGKIQWDLLKIDKPFGIKDKFQKDIWENDIIKTPNGDWGVIMWKAPFFEVTVSENESSLYSRDWFSECEIIGNIYENPELLK